MWRMCCLLLLGSAAEPLRAQSDVRWLTLSPTALNFSSADPDAGTAVASSTATWRIRFGSTTRTWCGCIPTPPTSQAAVKSRQPSAFHAARSRGQGRQRHLWGARPLFVTPNHRQGNQGDHNTIHG